ncbi:MAG: hypothetical protein DMF78_19545 [Acidobacteria bacterium]|nr:MAG: hypothetical protein DMF78_19545 [Acidobacteriota bacterium]
MADQEKPLRFDQAQFATEAAAALGCAACGKPLRDSYYEVNGKTACERCQTEVQLGRSEGSAPGRFLRASVFGLGAGAVGAAIWYAVRAATGYEVGLIAIVVGVMVGGAVRKGSRGRGGWAYQGLAMFLTYASIVSTYVPEVTKGVLAGINTSKEHAKAGAPASGPAKPTQAAVVAAPASAPAPVESAHKPSLGRLALAVTALGVVVFAIAFAAPFLAGLQNVMGIFIIAIGVYEAWKINRRVPLTITGPYRVGAPAPGTPAADAA